MKAKKLLALVLSLCLIVGLLPAAAIAAYDDTTAIGTDSEGKAISLLSFNKKVRSLAANGTFDIKLSAAAELGYTVPAGTVEIDLNGKALNLKNAAADATNSLPAGTVETGAVASGATLKIKDTAGGGSITMNGSSVFVNEGTVEISLTKAGGTTTISSTNGITNAEGATFTAEAKSTSTLVTGAISNSGTMTITGAATATLTLGQIDNLNVLNLTGNSGAGAVISALNAGSTSVLDAETNITANGNLKITTVTQYGGEVTVTGVGATGGLTGNVTVDSRGVPATTFKSGTGDADKLTVTGAVTSNSTNANSLLTISGNVAVTGGVTSSTGAKVKVDGNGYNIGTGLTMHGSLADAKAKTSDLNISGSGTITAIDAVVPLTINGDINGDGVTITGTTTFAGNTTTANGVEAKINGKVTAGPINNSGKMTIGGDKDKDAVEINGAAATAITNGAAGILTIGEGATVKNASGATLIVENSTVASPAVGLTITGGTFETAATLGVMDVTTGTAKVSVTGGEFEGNYLVKLTNDQAAADQVSVSGEKTKFTGTGTTPAILGGDDKVGLTITGGTFILNEANSTISVADSANVILGGGTYISGVAALGTGLGGSTSGTKTKYGTFAANSGVSGQETVTTPVTGTAYTVGPISGDASIYDITFLKNDDTAITGIDLQNSSGWVGSNPASLISGRTNGDLGKVTLPQDAKSDATAVNSGVGTDLNMGIKVKHGSTVLVAVAPASVTSVDALNYTKGTGGTSNFTKSTDSSGAYDIVYVGAKDFFTSADSSAKVAGTLYIQVKAQNAKNGGGTTAYFKLAADLEKDGTTLVSVLGKTVADADNTTGFSIAGASTNDPNDGHDGTTLGKATVVTVAVEDTDATQIVPASVTFADENATVEMYSLTKAGSDTNTADGVWNEEASSSPTKITGWTDGTGTTVDTNSNANIIAVTAEAPAKLLSVNAASGNKAHNYFGVKVTSSGKSAFYVLDITFTDSRATIENISITNAAGSTETESGELSASDGGSFVSKDMALSSAVVEHASADLVFKVKTPAKTGYAMLSKTGETTDDNSAMISLGSVTADQATTDKDDSANGTISLNFSGFFASDNHTFEYPYVYLLLKSYKGTNGLYKIHITGTKPKESTLEITKIYGSLTSADGTEIALTDAEGAAIDFTTFTFNTDNAYNKPAEAYLTLPSSAANPSDLFITAVTNYATVNQVTHNNYASAAPADAVYGSGTGDITKDAASTATKTIFKNTSYAIAAACNPIYMKLVPEAGATGDNPARYLKINVSQAAKKTGNFLTALTVNGLNVEEAVEGLKLEDFNASLTANDGTTEASAVDLGTLTLPYLNSSGVKTADYKYATKAAGGSDQGDLILTAAFSDGATTNVFYAGNSGSSLALRDGVENAIVGYFVVGNKLTAAADATAQPYKALIINVTPEGGNPRYYKLGIEIAKGSGDKTIKSVLGVASTDSKNFILTEDDGNILNPHSLTINYSGDATVIRNTDIKAGGSGASPVTLYTTEANMKSNSSSVTVVTLRDELNIWAKVEAEDSSYGSSYYAITIKKVEATEPDLVSVSSEAVTAIYDAEAKTLTLSGEVEVNEGNAASVELALTMSDQSEVPNETVALTYNAEAETFTATVPAETTVLYKAGITSADKIITTGLTVKAAEAEKTLTGITVTGPTKTTYKVGDTFDATGLVVTATYSDETTADVTGTYTAPDLSTTGSKTVTVSYTEGGVEKTANFTVTVTEDGTPVEPTPTTDADVTANVSADPTTGKATVTAESLSEPITTETESVAISTTDATSVVLPAAVAKDVQETANGGNAAAVEVATKDGKMSVSPAAMKQAKANTDGNVELTVKKDSTVSDDSISAKVASDDAESKAVVDEALANGEIKGGVEASIGSDSVTVTEGYITITTTVASEADVPDFILAQSDKGKTERYEKYAKGEAPTDGRGYFTVDGTTITIYTKHLTLFAFGYNDPATGFEFTVKKDKNDAGYTVYKYEWSGNTANYVLRVDIGGGSTIKTDIRSLNNESGSGDVSVAEGSIYDLYIAKDRAQVGEVDAMPQSEWVYLIGSDGFARLAYDADTAAAE